MKVRYNWHNRWELKEFTPNKKMLQIAKSFMKWNNMPYGIDRIDFGVTSEGLMLLMVWRNFRRAYAFNGN